MFDSRLLVVFTLQLEILVTTLFTPHTFFLNPPPPPNGWSMEIPRGLGGLKGRKFRGVQGVPTTIIFHRVVKDAINHTRHT